MQPVSSFQVVELKISAKEIAFFQNSEPVDVNLKAVFQGIDLN